MHMSSQILPLFVMDLYVAQICGPNITHSLLQFSLVDTLIQLYQVGPHPSHNVYLWVVLSDGQW